MMCDSDTTTAADELVDGAQGISLDGGGDHNDATAPIRCLVASTAASGRKPSRNEYISNKKCLGIIVTWYVGIIVHKCEKRCSQLQAYLFVKNSNNTY